MQDSSSNPGMLDFVQCKCCSKLFGDPRQVERHYRLRHATNDELTQAAFLCSLEKPRVHSRAVVDDSDDGLSEEERRQRTKASIGLIERIHEYQLEGGSLELAKVIAPSLRSCGAVDLVNEGGVQQGGSTWCSSVELATRAMTMSSEKGNNQVEARARPTIMTRTTTTATRSPALEPNSDTGDFERALLLAKWLKFLEAQVVSKLETWRAQAASYSAELTGTEARIAAGARNKSTDYLDAAAKEQAPTGAAATTAQTSDVIEKLNEEQRAPLTSINEQEQSGQLAAKGELQSSSVAAVSACDRVQIETNSHSCQRKDAEGGEKTSIYADEQVAVATCLEATGTIGGCQRQPVAFIRQHELSVGADANCVHTTSKESAGGHIVAFTKSNGEDAANPLSLLDQTPGEQGQVDPMTKSIPADPSEPSEPGVVGEQEEVSASLRPGEDQVGPKRRIDAVRVLQEPTSTLCAAPKPILKWPAPSLLEGVLSGASGADAPPATSLGVNLHDGNKRRGSLVRFSDTVQSIEFATVRSDWHGDA